MSDWPPPNDGKPLLTRDDLEDTFDSSAYLHAFYSGADNEPAMKLVLSLLPSLAERVSRHIPPGSGGLLDIGSGPTVHVACAFRNKMKEIYLSDYLAQNRDELQRWLYGEGRFDWSNITKFLAIMEGEEEEKYRMENIARSKIAGILPCDIFRSHIIPDHVPDKFDVITTFFCIEYATVDENEYENAVYNICDLVKPGGYLIMGGVMNSTWCQFGQVRYTCFTLTETTLHSALRQGGIDVDDPKTLRYYNHDDMFIILGRKKSS